MHLVLFFTRGISLETWASVGSLEREIALYLRLKEKGVRISFITFGGAEDIQYREQLGGIEILCNKWNLPPLWYERLLPFLHARSLSHAHIFKTNQINGADVALRSARLWRKPLIVRCGYMWSEFALRQGDPAQIDRAIKVESQVFKNANRIVVTTRAMKKYVEERYLVNGNKVIAFPNYVLTDLFSPDGTQPSSNKICYIGRLHEQKNLHALLQACEGLPVELHLIGEGGLEAALRKQAEHLDVKMVLRGNLPHHRLPEMIRQSAIFALVSHYEGHPKALLEAMSCGAAVLVADSPGIREQIIHGETAWLVKTDAASIRTGIQYLLDNPALRGMLGRNARSFIQENCALDKIVEMEYSLLGELVGDVR
jgi:glycosyltransferase involved in cell wall biosynthesis